ncbi:MAG: hypothetical protein N4A46_04965 [Schleiferiaceae bacterium]|jgi:hypothetical protein|nr:hypothetical protein [Schleiferiaceae bacterium]
MKNKVFKWFNEWGLFIIAIVVIVIYTILSSDISTQQALNKTVWTNVLFTIINLLSAFYIARKVSMWGWLTDTTNNQKKIAKTAIRHNRGNLASILKLIKITKEKIEKVDTQLTEQYLLEIQHHLEMIYNGLRNSEADFKEIVNEELKEQNAIEVEISELFTDIENKSNTIEELAKTTDKKEEQIVKLKQQLRDKENELSEKITSLPFGTSSFESGDTFNLLGDDNIKFVGKIALDSLLRNDNNTNL